MASHLNSLQEDFPPVGVIFLKLDVVEDFAVERESDVVGVFVVAVGHRPRTTRPLGNWHDLTPNKIEIKVRFDSNSDKTHHFGFFRLCDNRFNEPRSK